MIYSSLDNKKIKDIKKLNEKKYRDEVGLFLVEGEHLVKEAYDTGYLLYTIALDGITPLIDKDTVYVTDKVMKYLSGLDTYPALMGVCKKKNDTLKGQHLLLLDDVQDPGNLGTIIRSASAFDIDTIVISLKSADIYNPKVVRATQGLLFHTNIIVSPLEELIIKLKEDGYTILGTKVDGGVPIKTIEVSSYALIMGNEGSGVSKHILDLCDIYAYIPINDKCESLNVGVATGIILYELSR